MRNDVILTEFEIDIDVLPPRPAQLKEKPTVSKKPTTPADERWVVVNDDDDEEDEADGEQGEARDRNRDLAGLFLTR